MRWQRMWKPSLRLIKSVTIHMDLMDPTTKGSRSLLMRMQKPGPIVRSNPLCEIKSQLLTNYKMPYLTVVYHDDTTLHLATPNMKEEEIIFQMQMRTEQLVIEKDWPESDDEEEVEGDLVDEDKEF